MPGVFEAIKKANQPYNPNDPFTIRGYGEGAIQALIKERYRQGAAEALM